MKKRILCTGIHRSGSTLLYNAVRFIMSENFNIYGCWISEYDASNTSECHIIKTHSYNEIAKSSVVVASYRDIRDVIVSHRNKEGSTDSFTHIDWTIQQFLRYRDESVFIMRYEDYIEDPISVICRLCNALEVMIIEDDAIRMVKKLDNLKEPTHEQPRDKETQLHHGHRDAGGIVGTYKDNLSVEEIRCIEDRYKSFLQHYNYKIFEE